MFLVLLTVCLTSPVLDTTEAGNESWEEESNWSEISAGKCKSFCAKKVVLGVHEWPDMCKMSSCKGCAQCGLDYVEKPKCPHTPAPTEGKAPLDVITDLDHSWLLQLPCKGITCEREYTTLKIGGASQVGEKDLTKFQLTSKTYTDGTTQYCSAGFYASQDDGGTPVVVFHVPTSGVSTSGSKNPRVELREMDATGGKGGWSLGSTKSMSTTQRFVRLPAVHKSVTFTQLFDGTFGAFVEVQTRICSGRETMPDKTTKCNKGGLYAMVWMRDKTTKHIELTCLAPYKEGDKYTLKVDVSNFAITFNFQPEGGAASTYTAPCKEVATCGAASSPKIYFKTGAYIQNAKDEARNDYALLLQYATSHKAA